MNTADEQYTTLFCEGDGRIDIQDNGCASYPRVFFYQKEREVLDYIASLFPDGLFYQGEGAWQLRYNSSHCTPLLEAFSRHAVSKRFVEQLNKVLEVAGLSQTTQHPITLDGFVGFWDAEGSSFNSNLFVVQKDREILDIIAATFGGGVSCRTTYGGGKVAYNSEGYVGHQWYLSGEKARELAKVLMEKSHCPAKVERLHTNFEGPSYYARHHEGRTAYQQKVESRKSMIRKYIKAHPELVAKLQTEAQTT